MALAARLELDTGVDEPLAAQPLPDACLVEEVRDVVLEDARADARLDVLAAPRLEDDALDPRPVEQLRERETGRAGPDDRDLCARQEPPPRSNSAAWPWPTPTQRVASP